MSAAAAAAMEAAAPPAGPPRALLAGFSDDAPSKATPQGPLRPPNTEHTPSARSVDKAYRPRRAVAPPPPARVAAAAPSPTRSAASTSRSGTEVPTATTASSPMLAAAGTTTTSAVSPELHLARRASWGATPALVAEIGAKGIAGWLDAQLSPLSAVADSEMDALAAAQWSILSMPIYRVRDTYWPNSTGDLGYAAIQSYIARAIWSKRQLLEVMVDFWTNHLVVTGPWGDAWDSLHRYQIDVLRKHALGRYADMLVAAAKHPAMLQQLDNAFSSKRAPNENFGRELLELHTVGVDGGYLESDIRTSALILTGMSTEPESGEYYWRNIRHHQGKVSLLGWSHDNAVAQGTPVVESYLTYLARHPKTARRIVTKLAIRFVSDTPPSTLVDRLAQVYLDNDTAIAPVLRALFTSPEFADSAGQKTKRPLENMVSTLRVMGVTPGADVKGWLNGILWQAQMAGQAPMGWPAPNGYPDVAAAWSGAGTTLAVWNFHMSQCWSAADTTTTQMKWPALRSMLPTTLPTTYGAYVDALSQRLLQAPLPTAKRDAVCAFLDRTATSTLGVNDAAVGWRLAYVVALILDSPEFATR